MNQGGAGGEGRTRGGVGGALKAGRSLEPALREQERPSRIPSHPSKWASGPGSSRTLSLLKNRTRVCSFQESISFLPQV